MSKNYKKEKYYRVNVSNIEKENKLFKSILFNMYFPCTSRWNCALNQSSFKNKTISRLVNRCLLTRHRKKFHFLFKFSRLVFLRLARNGQIFGLKKSVW